MPGTLRRELAALALTLLASILLLRPLLIDGMGIPDIDVDMDRRHVVVVAEGKSAAEAEPVDHRDDGPGCSADRGTLAISNPTKASKN